MLHVDLYRVNDASELDELGLAPFPDGTLVLVEWPDRAGQSLPADRIDIAFSHRDGRRQRRARAVVTGHGAAEATVKRLAALRAFLEKSGALEATRRRMAGDASTRSYARLVVGWPLDDPDELAGARRHAADLRRQVISRGGPSRRRHRAVRRDRPRPCTRAAFPCPIIHQTDLDAGFLICEDLGSEGVLTGTPPAPIEERYHAATDVLVVLHKDALPRELPVEGRPNYAIPSFDVDAMLIEVSLLLDWYLPDRGVEVTAGMREAFFAMWRRLLDRGACRAGDLGHSRLSTRRTCSGSPGARGMARVGVIDFQDAVLGPPAYDVVSLAQDARVDMSEAIEIALVSRYVRGRKNDEPAFDPAAFAESYAMMSVQRNTRLLGVFSRLNRRDGKPHYLRHQPRIWGYLQRALAHPALAELRQWFEGHVPPPA